MTVMTKPDIAVEWYDFALWHPSNTSIGKFYQALVVEVSTPNDTRYVPVYNYGPGQADNFTTGALVLGSAHHSSTDAIAEATKKLSAKRKGGYGHNGASGKMLGTDPQGRTLVPWPVLNLIESNAALAAAAAAGAGAAPAAPAEKPKRTTTRVRAKKPVANSPEIERRAVEIMSLADSDVEKATVALRSLREQVETLRQDFGAAEEAYKMSVLYVQSRLQ